MTKTTGERLVAIETKLEDITNSINDLKIQLKEHTTWEDKKYESMRKDFAAKWSERAIYAIIFILIGIAFKVMVGGI